MWDTEDTIRTKGKHNTEYSTKQLYSDYRKDKKAKNELPLSDKTFREIRNECNLALSKLILEGEWFKLPFKLGEIGVAKYERFFHKLKHHQVNFKESKEKGYTVLYTDIYQYKWYWRKGNCRVKWKNFYKFKACRENSRGIAPRLAAGMDFYKINDREERTWKK